MKVQDDTYSSEVSYEARVLHEYDAPQEPSVVEHRYVKTVTCGKKVESEMGARFNYGRTAIEGKKVLMIGCGTLGNEIGKDLVKSGVSDLTVVDMDVYEPWNLPRSTMIQEEDVGLPKAQALARRLADASPFSVTVTGIDADITRLGYGFLDRFDLVTSPVDSWSIRSFASRGCRLLGKPHITAGTSHTGHYGGLLIGSVAVEPCGSGACYECLMPGNIKDQESKLSCTDMPKEVQPQVLPFSSAIAGYAAQASIQTLRGPFPRNRAGADNRSTLTYLNEMGFEGVNTAYSMRMSSPDPACSFHRILARTREGEIPVVKASRSEGVRGIWKKMADALGTDTDLELDFSMDRLYYLAFPEKRGDATPPPMGSMYLNDRDDTEEDGLLIAKMPPDHIYMAYCPSTLNIEYMPVRMVFGD